MSLCGGKAYKGNDSELAKNVYPFPILIPGEFEISSGKEFAYQRNQE